MKFHYIILIKQQVIIMKSIKAVLFDFDGTIADSLEVWTELDRIFFLRRSITADSSELDLNGLCFSEVAAYIKKTFGLKESAEKIKQEWRTLYTELFFSRASLKNKVYEFIKALKREGLKVCIGTSNDREIVSKIMTSSRLTDDIDHILTCCETGKSKPHPKVYLDLASKMNLTPPECIVFEDSPEGIAAGKNAGMKVVAVHNRANHRHEKQIIDESDFYIEDYSFFVRHFGDLASVLQNLKNYFIR